MKKYIFKVMVCTGALFTAVGYGYNADQGMQDACHQMSKAGDYPEDDIMDVCLIKVEDKI